MQLNLKTLFEKFPAPAAGAAGRFLKPVRRKIGVMILLLIATLVAGWVRSAYVQDTFEILSGKRAQIKIVSTSQRLMLVLLNFGTAEPTPSPFWSATKVSDTGWEMDLSLVNSSRAIVRNTLPKGIVTSDSVPLKVGNLTIMVAWYQARYWLILIPLMLLSAWLLLSRISSAELLPSVAEPKPSSSRKSRKKRR